MKVSRLTIVYLLFFQLINSYYGKAQEPVLKHFTVDNGLPSNEIYQVLEDHSGNLLIATDRGASRFNGYSFDNIQSLDHDVSSPVYYIYKSAGESIFFSGLKGNLYVYKNERLSNYQHNKYITSLFQHAGILIANSLAEHRDSLWISYNNDFNYNFKIGSCVVSPAGHVKKLDRPDGIYFDLRTKFYYRQLSDKNFQRQTQRLFIKWEDGLITKDSIELNWAAGYIRRLYSEKAGAFQLFCIGRRMLVYQNKKKVGSYLFPANVLSLNVINDQEFYVGLENGGASLYKLHNGIVQGPIRHSLTGLTVTCVYKDKQEGIWFSTQENGLFYQYPLAATGWQNDYKIERIEKKGKRVFLGFRNGIISVFENGTLIDNWRLPLEPGRFFSRFAFDKNDSLIAITSAGVYVKAHKSWSLYKSPSIFFEANSKQIIFGASGVLPELHVYRDISERPQKQILMPKRIISMCVDRDDNLWLGTWEGLFLYKNNELFDYTNENTVLRERIVAIKELKNGWVAVASLGKGLVLLKDKRRIILDMNNGLISPIINSMVIDGNDIWLGTNKGISKVVFDGGKFQLRHFGIEDGLPTIDIDEFTVLDGKLYLSWINKLLVISVDRLLRHEQILRTTIREVVVNDEKLEHGKLEKFGYDKNNFTFYFLSVNLSGAPKQFYQYKLEGFDKKWHVTTGRSVHYTNLPPGEYSFKVQAGLPNVNLNSSVDSFVFTIEEAFWERWWFKTAIIFAALFLLLFISQRRVVSIKKKNTLLLDLAESRQKALVQQINPHFIFNILNTVQSAILKQDKLGAASIISKFAKLMRLSLELGKEKLVPLEKEMELIDKYIALESIRTNEQISYLATLNSKIDPKEICVPSMLIQPFVENAIKHGLMHLTGKKGAITIQLSFAHDVLYCTVEDNGIGRENAQLINAAQNKTHQSSGIEITLNRLRLLHKEAGTKYFFEVTDKKDSGFRAAGTQVIFSLPFKYHERDKGCNY